MIDFFACSDTKGGGVGTGEGGLVFSTVRGAKIGGSSAGCAWGSGTAEIAPSARDSARNAECMGGSGVNRSPRIGSEENQGGTIATHLSTADLRG